MIAIKRAAALSPWVSAFGYSRAIRIGNVIEVAGTTAISEDGCVLHVGDPYLQTRAALEIIRQALTQLGGDLSQVSRTRVYLRNTEDWRSVGRAHYEAFKDHPPVSSCVGGVELLLPDLLVEIEASAFVL